MKVAKPHLHLRAVVDISCSVLFSLQDMYGLQEQERRFLSACAAFSNGVIYLIRSVRYSCATVTHVSPSAVTYHKK